jgi:hypothetical protein
MRGMKGRTTGGLALGVIAIVIAAAGGAYAADSGGTITVCVSHSGGNLYKANACKKSDKKLSWNLTGPQGPPGVQGIHGVQGLQGIQGKQGEPGPAGPASTQEAFNSLLVGNGSGAAVIVDCPTGTIATGGGGFSTGNSGAYMYIDTPEPGGSGIQPTAWQVGFQNNSGSVITINAYAVCAPAG